MGGESTEKTAEREASQLEILCGAAEGSLAESNPENRIGHFEEFFKTYPKYHGDFNHALSIIFMRNADTGNPPLSLSQIYSMFDLNSTSDNEKATGMLFYTLAKFISEKKDRRWFRTELMLALEHEGIHSGKYFPQTDRRDDYTADAVIKQCSMFIGLHHRTDGTHRNNHDDRPGFYTRLYGEIFGTTHPWLPVIADAFVRAETGGENTDLTKALMLPKCARDNQRAAIVILQETLSYITKPEGYRNKILTADMVFRINIANILGLADIPYRVPNDS